MISAVPVQIGPKPAPTPPGGAPGTGPFAAKSPESDDPYALVGVSFAVAPGVDADRELALAFAEEFALAGWSPERITEMFAAPSSGKANEIWQRRGAALIADVIGVVFGSSTTDGIED